MMNFMENSTQKKLVSFCTTYGQNPFLVQGAGGNISYKSKSSMFIKASGKRISNAEKENIFVEIDLNAVRKKVLSGDFWTKPVSVDSENMKPSIETVLHVLFPQKYVLHIHEVNAVAALVLPESESYFEHLRGLGFNFKVIEYRMPGGDLAKEIYERCESTSGLNLLLLKNHGIVIAAQTLDELEQKLLLFQKHLVMPTYFTEPKERRQDSHQAELPPGFHWSKNNKITLLAMNQALLHFVEKNWVLYPDHAVFLGAYPWILDKGFLLHQDKLRLLQKNRVTFIRSEGVVLSDEITSAEIDQLVFYYEVLIRVPPGVQPINLSSTEISKLINWDAEKYRQSLNKISIA